MSAKYTAGPWRVRPDGNGWRAVHDGIGSTAYQAVLSDDDVVALVVAYSPDPWSDAPPTEHIARLIAAAPDMLQALRRAVVALAGVLVDDQSPVAKEYEIVSAAIAKATGATP